MPNLIPTNHALLLASELEKRGVQVLLEHWDGHKHMDMFIPGVNICLEIDGLKHYVNPSQIISDLHRDYYSNREEIFTKHIPNELIDTHVEEIADAIKTVVDMETARLHTRA